MPTKVNERKMAPGLLAIATGLWLISKAQIIPSPILVSEKELCFLLLSICLVIAGLVLIKNAFHKA